MLLQQIVIGFILVMVGIVSLKYNFQLVNLTSRLEWIESKLGGGSTYLVYKIGSVLMILTGVIYMAGMGPAMIEWMTSPIRHLFSPGGGL